MLTKTGVPFAPPLGVLFIMKYLGMRIRKRRIVLLLIIPIISFVLVMTNDLHHWYYRVFEVDAILGIPFIYHEISMWYMVQGMYAFSCMLAAFLLALSKLKEITDVYRPQLIALMFGQLIPLVASFLYVIGFGPRGVDTVPMSLWISSAFYLWAISSSRLFSIMPIAKNAIFHSINDGVIVLDKAHRLLEFNRASIVMFPQLNKELYGEDFKTVWGLFTDQPLALQSNETIKEYKITLDQSENIYQMRVSPLIHVKHTAGYILIFTDITEQKKLQYKLERQAFYDELTGIHNRRAFFDKAETDFIEAKKAAIPYTIILLDIDYFKRVNDTYGHQIGDQVLKHVATSCKEQLTDVVLFARYGGEEFVLVLQDTLSEGESLANRVRKHIETSPLLTATGAIFVTVSCGVAMKGKLLRNY